MTIQSNAEQWEDGTFKTFAQLRLEAENAALRKRLAEAEKERDSFLLLADIYDRFCGQRSHDTNRFLAWVRENAGRPDIPELVSAFFEDMAETSRKLYEDMKTLVCSPPGWKTLVEDTRLRRLAALAPKEKP